METRRRDQLQQSLRSLVQSYRAMMELMEQTLAMFCEELALDPVMYFQARPGPPAAQTAPPGFRIDPAVLSVHFQDRVCFLGNSLPFKFLCRLAQRPNTYVSYEDLLSEVWEGVRSDEAVRSVVKSLRSKLRQAGLADLADAIDGSVAGHYALQLPA